MWHNMMGWNGPGLSMIFWLIIFVVLILIVVKLFQGQQSSTGSTENALDILNKRYARGEITKEEYEQMKKDLTS